MTGLSSRSWTDLADRPASADVLLVPLGATEQHGPHLPVTTDTDIALALATGAADRDPRLVVAPPVAYGASGEHQDFPGTLSVGQEATELYLVELGRSATTHFDAVVVVSAHGGNHRPLRRAVARLAHEGRAVMAWSPGWDGDLHAGRTETSLMLAIAPDRVHADRAQPGDGRPLGELLPLLRAHGVRPISANGVLGDPSGAGADEGRRLLEGAVGELIEAAERLRNRTRTEVTG
ncbi:MAG: mycofactocin biosynthesis peptidyl-dipeptidase MftE [Acidimicrobiales bacterium]